jgi:hypothetical protein
MATEAAADSEPEAARSIEAIASSAQLDDDVAAHLALDGADPLSEFRPRFLLPTPAARETFERYRLERSAIGLAGASM